ncbi:DUF6350 family protein [Herbiconiux sp. L3-i23]|uniref:cell division protein PerM n=1 Tax=Herbiconiux sp. L3-i23 TaxID=2905871 RepID=UPI00206CA033|nr:DUF6350 family protein [Herbiconiux sp. L3-i23]BDI23799.1 hypothetical protein L3i23_25750 [Herbiconiux sp. L3-i23]
MNRPLTALFAALEAVLVVGIGVGLALAPLTALWAFQYDLQIDWAVFYRAAVDVWLLGHGVDVRFALTFPGATSAAEPFVVTAAALGFALLTVLLGVRAGRRLLETDHPVVALGASIVTFVALAAGLVLTAGAPEAQPSRWQGVLLPTLAFCLGVLLGAVLPGPGARRPVSSRRGPVSRAWEAAVDRIPPDTATSIACALRLGGMATAGLVAVAAILVAVLIVTGYTTVITIYESLQAGVLGGLALTLAQLAVLPNLVIWAVAWLTGPGFSIGTGSSVSPLETSLGPVPSLPVLGALPTGDMPFAFVGLAVPVVVGFVAAAISRGRVDDEFGGRPGVGRLVGIGVGAGVFAGLVLGLLTWMASGSAGPGRLQDVGASPVAVALAGGVLLTIAIVLGLLAGRSRRAGADVGSEIDGVDARR